LVSGQFSSNSRSISKRVGIAEARNKKVAEPTQLVPIQPEPRLVVIERVEKWRPLVAKYFEADQIDNALKIMNAESGGNPKAHNLNHQTRDNSYGLFQINLYGGLAKSRPQGWQLLDPEFNVKYAAELQGKQSWKIWSTHKVLE